jgi:hypothetical protein
MRALFILLFSVLSLALTAQRNVMLDFGAGINILTEGGSKLNWSIGARAYSQFARTSFFSGGLDYNRFTSKFASLCNCPGTSRPTGQKPFGAKTN